MQLNIDYLVLESFIDPSTLYPKLPYLKSRAGHTGFTTTVLRDISLISSFLDPEGTWAEAAHSWLFVDKLVGIRGGSFFFTKLSLVNFMYDTLKAYHAYTNMEFMW